MTRILISDIKRRVGAEHGVSIAEMDGRERVEPIISARREAMFLARELTDHSYPAIARQFGGRDHTTVMSAVRRAEALLESESCG